MARNSRGRIGLRSANPFAPLMIRRQLLGAEEDVETLARGVEIGRAILKQPPIAAFVREERRPGADIRGTALRAYLRNASIPLDHPVGTCRIGHGRGGRSLPESARR